MVAVDKLRKTGTVDPKLADLCRFPDLLPENGRRFSAWLTLHRQRQVGMDACPLAMSDIESWMRMAGIPESSRASLLRGVLAAEHGWREGYAEARRLEEQVDGERPRP